ncbi:hypothetical protein AC1031_002234 [Aphanomyces cochlioides]|nr:hypothetical protein AC1031_002234 [Aphanomyces cochlioides]
MSEWERAARDQIRAKNDSLQENERLWAQVDETAAYMEELAFILRKKPRLLLQTAFIKAGLWECTEQVIRDENIQQPNGRIILVYRAYRNIDGRSVAYSNVVYKYYTEVDREVIVWRSVLEDELMPHMREGTVQDKWGWLVVKPTRDPGMCLITFLFQTEQSPLYKDKQAVFQEYVDANNLIMEKYAFGKRPETPGTFPGGTVNDNIEVAIPFTKRSLVGRDKYLELTLKRVIDEAVLDFQSTKQSTGNQTTDNTTANVA